MQRLIEGRADAPLDERVRGIIAEVGELEHRDDLTLLALCDREPPPASALLEIEIPARADALGALREQVRACLERGGLDEPCCADVVMAVDEACQNIIRHAYRGDPEGRIGLRIERRGDRIELLLSDDAPRTDPSRVKPRDLDDVRPGGLGTHLIASVMDETDFLAPPSGRGNLLRMVKRIR